MSEDQSHIPRYLDPALQHEAGGGWHGEGLNQAVWGAVMIRDSLLEDQSRYEGDEGLDKAIRVWDGEVERLKAQHGLNNPPFIREE